MSFTVPQPVITYRHLVSAGTLNASNPLRVISLVDVDAAYAAFEAKRLGLDASIEPIAVKQWNGLIAISHPARKYGISRHETYEVALQKCPHLKVVHVATYAEGEDEAKYHEDPRSETHKVSLDVYRRESRKIVKIFNELCPLGAVEKASIDELYCDLTLAVRQLILQRFPELSRPPTDSNQGLDTPLPPPPKIDWTNLGYRLPTETPPPKPETIAAEQSDADPVEQTEVIGADAGETTSDSAIAPPGPVSVHKDPLEEPVIEQASSWADYALAGGAELVYMVRQEVIKRLGYTMSAGIASNKTIAKLTASQRKPNGQSTMLPAAVPIFLKDLPFQKIRFLGGKLGDAIASEWESSTVGDLWNVSLLEMQQKFGDESRWVYDVLRGIDHSAVIERTANKTMLASKNVKPPIRTQREAQRWLSILSLELCVRLKEAREESGNLWPSTLVLRYLKIGETARSRQMNFPYIRELKPESIMAAAEKLWNESLGGQIGEGKESAEVIVIALGFSGLHAGEAGQKSLEGFFSNRGEQAAPKSATSAETEPSTKRSTPMPEDDVFALSQANQTDGDLADSSSGSTLSAVRKNKKVKRNGIESLFQRAAASSQVVTREEWQEHESPDQRDAPETLPDVALGPSWTCPECSKKVFPRPPAALESDGSADGKAEADAQRRLTLAMQDHQDYHFAMALQQEDRAVFMPRPSQAALPPSSTQRGGTQGKGAKAKKEPGKGSLSTFFKKG